MIVLLCKPLTKFITKPLAMHSKKPLTNPLGIRVKSGAFACHHAHYQSKGFTLFELLVVIFIIGIMLTFAGLSVRQHGGQVLEDEAKRLHHLIHLASEEAVLQMQELAVQFSPSEYQFATLQDNKWQAIEEDRLFRKRELPDTIRLKVEIEGVIAQFTDKDEEPPTVQILSSGQMSPFIIKFVDDEGAYYAVEGDINGKLQLKRPSDDEL